MNENKTTVMEREKDPSEAKDNYARECAKKATHLLTRYFTEREKDKQ
jgi:hypothetical protein